VNCHFTQFVRIRGTLHCKSTIWNRGSSEPLGTAGTGSGMMTPWKALGNSCVSAGVWTAVMAAATANPSSSSSAAALGNKPVGTAWKAGGWITTVLGANASPSETGSIAAVLDAAALAIATGSKATTWRPRGGVVGCGAWPPGIG